MKNFTTVLGLACALFSLLLFFGSCDHDIDFDTELVKEYDFPEPNHAKQELTSEEFLEMSNSLHAFNQLFKSINNSSKSILPLNVRQIWKDSVLVKVSEPFNFKEIEKNDNSGFLLLHTELADAQLYMNAFEPFFDAMEIYFENERHENKELVAFLTAFEKSIGVNLLDGIDNPYPEKLFGRRTYCCCCVENIGNYPALNNCKQFRARRWWAKIRCKIIRRIFGCTSGTTLDRGRC